jgi:membrane protein YdbS with pleckstrin-like domain
MYCIKCGADNLETAKFCRKCGVAIGGQTLDAEEETRVVLRRGDEERGRKGERENHPVTEAVPPLLRKEGSLEEEAELFAISPTLFFVKVGYVAAAVGALILVGLTSAFLWYFVSVGVSVLIGLLLLLVPAFYHIRQKMVRYTLTGSTLEMDSGFVSKTTRNVPLRRIQDVTVSATPWQRLVGIGDVVIDNASEEGGKIVLKNINSPRKHADTLLQQMRRLER